MTYTRVMSVFEALVQMHRLDLPYLQVPLRLLPVDSKSSLSLRLGTLYDVMRTVARLLYWRAAPATRD